MSKGRKFLEVLKTIVAGALALAIAFLLMSLIGFLSGWMFGVGQ